jgi:hypothetical protein
VIPDVDSLIRLGNELEDEVRLEEALRLYQRAVELAAGSSGARLNLGTRCSPSGVRRMRLRSTAAQPSSSRCRWPAS